MAEADQYNNAETAAGMTSGRMLLRAREKKNMSLEDVAGHLHLAESVIRAIEQDDDVNMPAPIYVRGYLRSYAAVVGVDADDVVSQYNSRVGSDDAPLNLEVNSRPATRQAQLDLKRKPVLLAGGAVIVLVAVLGLATLFGGGDEPAPANGQVMTPAPEKPVNDKAVVEAAKEKIRAAAVTVPAQKQAEKKQAQKKPEEKKGPAQKQPAVAGKTVNKQVTDPVSNTPAGKVTITKTAPVGDDVLKISFRQASWVVIHDANDRRLLFRTARAGREYRLRGSKPFRVFLGNAEAATIVINGENFNHKAFVRKNKTARFIVGEAAEQQ